MRAGRALAVLALALAGAGAWALWPPAALEARFGPEDCRGLALEDAGTGRPIAGIEDIAAHGDALFLSAQDRLAAERAAARGEEPPEGGLYRLPLARLAEPGPIRLRQQAEGFRGPLHPHGIHARLAKLVAINREYGPEGGAGGEVRVYAIREDRLEALRRLPAAGLCAANDLILDGVEVRLTLDREGCPGVSLFEMALGGATGRVGRMGAGDDARARLAREGRGLAFANGIARVEAGLAVAETRAGRIALLTRGPDGAPALAGEIAVPGGPDNLTVAPDGRLVAALHPSLPRLAFYRHGWTEAAPARIVAVEPRTGAVEPLWDDPDGALLPGATVGVLTEDGALVAGSVRAGGLLVCGAAP